MALESKNPFLKDKAFQKVSRYDAQVIDNPAVYTETMTVQGTINKSFILLALLIATACVTWYMTMTGINPIVPMIGGAIVGLILVIIASFKPQHSGFLAPGYALFEGLFIGGISAYFDMMYPGIVIQAVGATFVTFMVCFGLYRFKIVKVTERFKSVVIAATLAIATYYIISWLLSMFTSFIPVHHGNSLMSIGISVFVIVIAALNLFLDFDQIEKGAEMEAPKYMEWYSAMGLMITLVWLYVEFLRLLSKINSRN
ncbi:Bax inhibitor-1/YccA family protein [Flavobacterium sp. '19STA2R22 D10 B1']|uniref:Bax inhibitor-1/YccA family protein n=1 Tax=Flavobacterium aerium TaxID=3037261 RepID=UPI00278BD05F|nr:Bax inhibitor-1/YccA family protein [Flavobacterium sp. '19STA2R22 D10 B1']